MHPFEGVLAFLGVWFFERLGPFVFLFLGVRLGLSPDYFVFRFALAVSLEVVHPSVDPLPFRINIEIDTVVALRNEVDCPEGTGFALQPLGGVLHQYSQLGEEVNRCLGVKTFGTVAMESECRLKVFQGCTSVCILLVGLPFLPSDASAEMFDECLARTREFGVEIDQLFLAIQDEH